MIGIHRKNSSIMLRPTEVQGLIQDLVYARKAVSRTSDRRIIDEVAHLFNETSISMIKFKKTHNQSSSICAQKIIRGNFSSIATGRFGLETQFSQLIKS